MTSLPNWPRRAALCLSACLLASAAQAQLFSDAADTHWREGEVPQPPALSSKNMVQIDMPSYSSLLVGVDIDSVSVTPHDGVVRYVTVLQGADGSLSAYYQGVHCANYTGRTYARYRFDANPPGWENIDESWHELRETKSRYARAIAQSGACENSIAPANTAIAQRNFAKNSPWPGKKL